MSQTLRENSLYRLHARAVEQYNLGKPAQALATLNRALRSVDSANLPVREANILLARIWISIALNEAEVYSLQRGLRALDTAQDYSTLAADPGVAVLLHCQRGLIQLRGGRLDAALASFEAAVEYVGFVEPRDQSSIWLNRGTVLMLQGRLKQARRDLAEAARVASESHLLWSEFKALHNLGYLEFLAGNLPAALGRMDEAWALNAGVSEGVTLLDRARVLIEAGLDRGADEALSRAATIFKTNRLGQDLAETHLARAECALLSGDIALARRLAGRARDQFRRRGSNRWRRSAELVLLQSDLAAQRPGARLAGPAQRLREELEAEGLRLPARTAALITVEAFVAAGQREQAVALLSSLAPGRRHDPITTRLHERYVVARVAAVGGDTRAAGGSVRRGLAELADYQASFGSVDLRTAAAVHGRRLAGLDLEIALSSGRASVVFAAAERARAVASRLPSVRPPADARTADLLAELRQVAEAQRAVDQDREASAPMQRRRRELEREITARGWRIPGIGGVRRTARLVEIAEAIGMSDAVMTVYVEVAGALHAVVVHAGGRRVRSLGPSVPIIELVRRLRADLDVLAQPRLAGGILAAVRSSFDRAVRELDAALLAPLAIDGKRLVIVSTGIFGQLPWGMLPSLRGVPVVVAPSATTWLAAEEQRTRSRRHNVIALAGPGLPHGGDEIRGIGNAWRQASPRLDHAADRPALTSAMASGTVVHLAAHGMHQVENPLFSSLLLADGPMFAHEMDQTARTPEHVVLSACELGLATVRPGDEALGLTSVLLRLGTRSVVASVARVSDEVTAETMIAYHQRLASGLDSAAALADATSSSSGVAPFVCFGAAWAP